MRAVIAAVVLLLAAWAAGAWAALSYADDQDFAS